MSLGGRGKAKSSVPSGSSFSCIICGSSLPVKALWILFSDAVTHPLLDTVFSSTARRRQCEGDLHRAAQVLLI